MQALYGEMPCNLAPGTLGSSERHTERAAPVKRRYNSSLPAGRVCSEPRLRLLATPRVLAAKRGKSSILASDRPWSLIDATGRSLVVLAQGRELRTQLGDLPIPLLDRGRHGGGLDSLRNVLWAIGVPRLDLY